jgi:hypothetical protein
MVLMFIFWISSGWVGTTIGAFFPMVHGGGAIAKHFINSLTLPSYPFTCRLK